MTIAVAAIMAIMPIAFLYSWLNSFFSGTAARREARNWRHLWGRTGQIAAFGTVGYYGFTTSEETKRNSIVLVLFYLIRHFLFLF